MCCLFGGKGVGCLGLCALVNRHGYLDQVGMGLVDSSPEYSDLRKRRKPPSLACEFVYLSVSICDFLSLCACLSVRLSFFSLSLSVTLPGL